MEGLPSHVAPVSASSSLTYVPLVCWQLDSIISEFLGVCNNCIYIFDLQRAELRLMYAENVGTDDQSRELVKERELSAAELLDFEQRLGFVQHEEKAKEAGGVDDWLTQVRVRSMAVSLRTLTHDSVGARTTAR